MKKKKKTAAAVSSKRSSFDESDGEDPPMVIGGGALPNSSTFNIPIFTEEFLDHNKVNSTKDLTDPMKYS